MKNVATNDKDDQRTALPPPPPVPRGSASSLAASLCNAWEDMVNKWLEPLPLRPSIDPEVISRGATSGREMRWFDVLGFSPMHVLNAWEEEGEGAGAGEDDGPANNIVLVAPNMLNVPHLLEGMEHAHSCVEMLRIDLKNSTVTRTPLSVASLDMGVINAAYVGKKNRYAYLAMAGPFPKMRGVAKLDFELAKRNKDCVVACREYGPGCYGGEPFFVSKDEACRDEDDGYLVTYVHDENSGESRFVVMDAKSPELDVVAEVLLPRRVPYGFHGIFVRESELRDQQIL